MKSLMVITRESHNTTSRSTKRFARASCTAAHWYLICVLLAKFRGLVYHRLASFSNPNFGIIHDLTFASTGGRTSVDGDTDFDSAPPSELGHVFREVLLRVMLLRQTHSSSARILL